MSTTLSGCPAVTRLEQDAEQNRISSQYLRHPGTPRRRGEPHEGFQAFFDVRHDHHCSTIGFGGSAAMMTGSVRPI